MKNLALFALFVSFLAVGCTNQKEELQEVQSIEKQIDKTYLIEKDEIEEPEDRY